MDKSYMTEPSLVMGQPRAGTPKPNKPLGPNPSRTRAFNAVRFACRLNILLRRLQESKAALLMEPDLEAAMLETQALITDAGRPDGDDSARSPHGAQIIHGASPSRSENGCFPRASIQSEHCSVRFEQVSMIADAAEKVHKEASMSSQIMSDVSAISELVRTSWVSIFLVCCPLGIASYFLEWGATPTFFLNFMVLVPLAMTLGDITEDLALRMGSVAGGLLNATFGNVTELVLSIAALRNGLLDVVADSLLGSILSNLLLVLGCCFLVGGFIYKRQSFNGTSNRTCGSLLFLASIGIAIPTSAASMIENPSRPDWILTVSRGTSVVLLFCYMAYLVFQLGTHKHLFDDWNDEDGCDEGVEAALLPGGDDEQQDEQDVEMPVISAVGGVVALATISALVALHSEYLTRSIEQTSTETGITTGFLAMIVLPIAGNACEHITAVMVAARNKMDLSLGIALGSSLQIALFIIPFMVIVGWVIGQPMSLDYDYFSVLALVLSVIHANFVNSDATSHWLMGVQLCAVYVLIALVYWFR